MRCVLTECFFIALVPEIAATALVIGVILTLIKFKIVKKAAFRPLPLDVPVLIFIVLAGLSVFRSPDRGFSFYNYYHLVGAYGLTYFFIGQNIGKTYQIKKIAIALAASAGLCLLYGFYQYAFGLDVMDARWVDGTVFPGVSHRVFSTWENPNIFAGYLDTVIAVALGYFAYAKNNTQRLALVVILLLAATCLMLTYARGACLTLALVLLVFGTYKDWRVAAVGLAAAVFAVVVNPALAERLANVLTAQDTSVEMRWAFWDATWAMIQDHPFLGIGWGAYWLVYPAYDSYLQGASIIIYHAHNMYLNYAAEIGVVGAGAFFWFFFGTMKLAFDTNLLPSSEDEADEGEANGDNKNFIRRIGLSDNMLGSIIEKLTALPPKEKTVKPKRKYKIMKLVKITQLPPEETATDENVKKKDKIEKIKKIKKIDEKEDKATENRGALPRTPARLSSPAPATEKTKGKVVDITAKLAAASKPDEKKEPTLSERLGVSYADLAEPLIDAGEADEYDKRWENIKQNLAAGEPLEWCNALSLGIGLAILAMALNGFTDNLLFNFPTSLLFWLLAALAAVNADIEDDPKATKRNW